MDEWYTFAVLLVLTGLLLWSWEFTGKLQPRVPPETTKYVARPRKRSWAHSEESNNASTSVDWRYSPRVIYALRRSFRLGLVLLYVFAILRLAGGKA